MNQREEEKDNKEEGKAAISNIILGTVPKGLEERLEELEIRGRIETIQTTTIRVVRILRRVLET